MAAAWEGDASVEAELLKHGANATLVNSERRSALMLDLSTLARHRVRNLYRDFGQASKDRRTGRASFRWAAPTVS